MGCSRSMSAQKGPERGALPIPAALPSPCDGRIADSIGYSALRHRGEGNVCSLGLFVCEYNYYYYGTRIWCKQISAPAHTAQFTTSRLCVIAPDSLSGPTHSVRDGRPDGLKVTF